MLREQRTEIETLDSAIEEFLEEDLLKKEIIVKRQMAEIWRDCAVCHTSMKFCWDTVFCIIIKM